MPFCPDCRAEYRDGFTRCADCDVDLVPDLDGVPNLDGWVGVYTGPEASVRLVEMRLKAFGIPSQRLPGPHAAGAMSEFYTPHLAGYQLLVPGGAAERQADRIAEAVRSGAAPGAADEDPAAMAEAEEDYDVRACPACALYFHDNYAACPGCGAPLVPAVEIFEAGQAEPDRVIIADGDPAAARALSARLREAGFAAEAFEVEGWPVAAVDLPWSELIDRTAEAEQLTGLTPPPPPA